MRWKFDIQTSKLARANLKGQIYKDWTAQDHQQLAAVDHAADNDYLHNRVLRRVMKGAIYSLTPGVARVTFPNPTGSTISLEAMIR